MNAFGCYLNVFPKMQRGCGAAEYHATPKGLR